LVTKEGHHVLDVIFTTPIPDLGMLMENHCNKGAKLSLNPSNHFFGESFIAGCFAIFFFLAGQVAEELEKISGVVDHGIICSNQ